MIFSQLTTTSQTQSNICLIDTILITQLVIISTINCTITTLKIRTLLWYNQADSWHGPVPMGNGVQSREVSLYSLLIVLGFKKIQTWKDKDLLSCRTSVWLTIVMIIIYNYNTIIDRLHILRDWELTRYTIVLLWYSHVLEVGVKVKNIKWFA